MYLKSWDMKYFLRESMKIVQIKRISVLLYIDFYFQIPRKNVFIRSCNECKEEFILMENEFEQLKKKAGIETKVYDELKLSLLNYEK